MALLASGAVSFSAPHTTMPTKPSALARGTSGLQLVATAVGLVIALGTPLVAAHDRLSRAEWKVQQCETRMSQVEAINERLARIEEKLDAVKERLNGGKR